MLLVGNCKYMLLFGNIKIILIIKARCYYRTLKMMMLRFVDLEYFAGFVL